jgi:hypothetical protein
MPAASHAAPYSWPLIAECALTLISTVSASRNAGGRHLNHHEKKGSPDKGTVFLV